MLELSAHRRPTAGDLLARRCFVPFEDMRVDSQGRVVPVATTVPEESTDPWYVSRRGSAASRRSSLAPVASLGAALDSPTAAAAPAPRRASVAAASPWSVATESNTNASSTTASNASSNAGHANSGAAVSAGARLRRASHGVAETSGSRGEDSGSRYTPSMGQPPRRQSRPADPWREAASRRSSAAAATADATSGTGAAARGHDRATRNHSPDSSSFARMSIAAHAPGAAQGQAQVSGQAPGLARPSRAPLPAAYRRSSFAVPGELSAGDGAAGRRRRASEAVGGGASGRQWLLRDMPSPDAVAADVLPVMAEENRRDGSRKWSVPTGMTMRPQHTRGMHRSLFEAPIAMGVKLQ